MSATHSDYTIEDLTDQIPLLELDSFSHTDAWSLGLRIREVALFAQAPIAAAVWMGDQVLFHTALPGSSADNDSWLARKAALVRRYNEPSLLTTLRFHSHGLREASPHIGLNPTTHALAGGAVPLRIQGVTVAIAAISGLSDHADHALLIQALSAVR